MRRRPPPPSHPGLSAASAPLAAWWQFAAVSRPDALLESQNSLAAARGGLPIPAITDRSQMSSKPLRSSRRRHRKSPNGAGGVSFNQTTGRWMGRYTTDDPETGLSVRKAVYGHTEQEARAKLIEALAARQAGSLLVSRGRELTLGQYAEHWLAGLRKRPTTRARYRQALAHITGDGLLNLLRLGPAPIGYRVHRPLPVPPVCELICRL